MSEAAATLDDVEKAATWLEAAAAGDEPLHHSIAALHLLRNCAVIDPMIVEHAAALAPRLEKALWAAAPVLSADVHGSISGEEIFIALGGAAALVAKSNDEFRSDRVLYAGRLVAKLIVVLHERALTARGDPLARAIAIRRAADALPAGMVQ